MPPRPGPHLLQLPRCSPQMQAPYSWAPSRLCPGPRCRVWALRCCRIQPLTWRGCRSLPARWGRQHVPWWGCCRALCVGGRWMASVNCMHTVCISLNGVCAATFTTLSAPCMPPAAAAAPSEGAAPTDACAAPAPRAVLTEPGVPSPAAPCCLAQPPRLTSDCREASAQMRK